MTTFDHQGRPLEIRCYNEKKQLISRVYVDTANQQIPLPLRTSQPARFGNSPGALANYLRVAGPWPGNIDGFGTVIFTVLIGADGQIKDARLRKSLDQMWPGCTPLARQRVLTMPRWQPAQAQGKAVMSLMTVSVRFGLEK